MCNPRGSTQTAMQIKLFDTYIQKLNIGIKSHLMSLLTLNQICFDFASPQMP